jgi:hypothetical protein
VTAQVTFSLDTIDAALAAADQVGWMPCCGGLAG